MDGADLVKECERMGVTPSSKHIENIQNLFEQLKKIEAEIESEGGVPSSPSGQTQQQQQSSPYHQRGQPTENLFRKPNRIDKMASSNAGT
jgi:hypothetical protein